MDILSIILGVAGFSLKSIFIKLSYLTGMSPEILMSWRMLFSLPVFAVVYVIARYKKGSTHSKEAIFTVIVSAVLYYSSGILDMSGLKSVPVGLERIILFTIPIFVVLFSFLFQGKRYRTRIVYYILMSWVGIVISFGGKQTYHLNDSSVIIGALMVLSSACFYAIYMIMSVKGVKHYGAVKFNALVMMFSCIPALIPLMEARFSDVMMSINEKVLLMPFNLAVISTVIPSFLMMYGIKRCGPTLVATINNLGPFITIVFGYYFLGENVTKQDLIGMVVVIVSIALLSKEMSFKGSKNESSSDIWFRKKKRDNSGSIREGS